MLAIKSSKKYWFIAAVIMLIAFVGFFYLTSYRSKPAQDDDQVKPTYVSAVDAALKSYHPIESIIARAHADQSATLITQVNARVESVSIKSGIRVQKGDVLVKLNQKEFKIALKQSKSRLADLNTQIELNNVRCQYLKTILKDMKQSYRLEKKHYKRYVKLHEKEASSKAQKDQAHQSMLSSAIELKNRRFEHQRCVLKKDRLKAQKQEAKASVSLAKKNLADTLIKAPFTGIVTEKFVSQGMFVQSGQSKLLSMYDPSSIELKGLITQKHISEVQKVLKQEEKTQKIKACLSRVKNKRCFYLDRIGGNINTSYAGRIAYFKPLNGSSLVKGETLRLYVRLPAIKAVAVPDNAVYRENRVYVIRNGQLKPIRVTIAGGWYKEPNKHYQLIQSSHLQQNDQILANYLPQARKGMRVTIQSGKK